MGGSKTVVQSAAPMPQQPTLSGTYADYAANFPKMVELERQYGPELAQMDFNLFKQYSPMYAQIADQVNKDLYPETAGLQENLARQAREGMEGGLPDWAKQQYESNFNAGLGMNANAPLGVSDRNVGLLNLQKQWSDYYRDLGLSAAGRQPLAQAGNPSFRNPNEGFGGAMSFASQNYGTAAGMYNNSLYGTRRPGPGSMIGGAIGAGAGMFAGNPFMGASIGSMIGGGF